jgi:hypothetical protein
LGLLRSGCSRVSLLVIDEVGAHGSHHAQTIVVKYATRTCTRSINTRIALATTRKGASTMIEFYSKMKSYADEMTASGQTLGDEEFVAYVLTGLDEEIYNSFVPSIVTVFADAGL